MDTSHTETSRLSQPELPFACMEPRETTSGQKTQTPIKVCFQCKQPFPRTNEYFTKNAQYKDGLDGICKACVKAKNKAYYLANAERENQRKQRWAKNNPEKEKARYLRRRPWYEANLKKRNQQAYANNRLLKEEVFTAYGHRCECCGETETRFLNIEHTRHDGKAHRKITGGGGTATYRWLKKNGFPRDGYCLLCSNCNWVTRWGDVCPHRDPTLPTTDLEPKGKSWAAIHGARLRHKTLMAYGHRCTCCGETRAQFLTIEHLNPPQWNGKRPQSTKGAMLYRMLKRQGWPKDDYTLLCHSCNWVQHAGEPCPHKEKQ